jgi:DNA end-binding protein Ku
MRAIWSGSLSFGLVNIPVKLFSATQQQELNFDMLSKKDMSPIRYARISTSTNKEIPWKEIVKGIEIKKGKYVVVTEEDFAKASPEKSRAIDIIQFVQEKEIDPIYYDKPYYLAPDKGADKSYFLLLRALEQSKKVALADFMLRNRNHVCAVKPYEGVLLLNQMRYQSEIREVPEIPDAKKAKLSPKEIDLALKLIDQLSETFEPSAFKDTYVESLKKLIDAKAAGKKIATPAERKVTADVKDLMSVLKQSLSTSSSSKRKVA